MIGIYRLSRTSFLGSYYLKKFEWVERITKKEFDAQFDKMVKQLRKKNYACKDKNSKE